MLLADKQWMTDSAPPDQRWAYWLKATREAVFELDLSAAAPAAFQGVILQRQIGPIKVSEFRISQGETITRSKRAITSSSAHQFELMYLRRGHVTIKTEAREIFLAPGQSILLHSQSAFTASHPAAVVATTFHFPDRWLKMRIADPEQLLVRIADRSTRWGKIVFSTMKAITESQVHSRDTLVQSVEVLAGALALALDAPEQRNGGEDVSLPRDFVRALAVLDARASDPSIVAADVAYELGISLRKMHMIFASARTSYVKELRCRRFANVTRMFNCSQFEHLSTAEIAWRCGFNDLSHFARNFKRQYGIPPALYRGRGARSETVDSRRDRNDGCCV